MPATPFAGSGAIGIPHYATADSGDLSALRERAGINEFYRERSAGS